MDLAALIRLPIPALVAGVQSELNVALGLIDDPFWACEHILGDNGPGNLFCKLNLWPTLSKLAPAN